jgi:hypothetical protein
MLMRVRHLHQWLELFLTVFEALVQTCSVAELDRRLWSQASQEEGMGQTYLLEWRNASASAPFLKRYHQLSFSMKLKPLWKLYFGV